jgi:hypothetical protein
VLRQQIHERIDVVEVGDAIGVHVGVLACAVAVDVQDKRVDEGVDVVEVDLTIAVRVAAAGRWGDRDRHVVRVVGDLAVQRAGDGVERPRDGVRSENDELLADGRREAVEKGQTQLAGQGRRPADGDAIVAGAGVRSREVDVQDAGRALRVVPGDVQQAAGRTGGDGSGEVLDVAGQLAGAGERAAELQGRGGEMQSAGGEVHFAAGVHEGRAVDDHVGVGLDVECAGSAGRGRKTADSERVCDLPAGVVIGDGHGARRAGQARDDTVRAHDATAGHDVERADVGPADAERAVLLPAGIRVGYEHAADAGGFHADDATGVGGGRGL